MAPSAYWGEQKIWDTRVNNHNSIFDEGGRVWMAAAFRGPDNPAYFRPTTPEFGGCGDAAP